MERLPGFQLGVGKEPACDGRGDADTHIEVRAVLTTVAKYLQLKLQVWEKF